MIRTIGNPIRDNQKMVLTKRKVVHRTSCWRNIKARTVYVIPI